MTTISVDKYCSKHTGIQINVQASIGETHSRIKIEGVYIQ